MADPALSFPTQLNVPTGGGAGSLPPQSTLSSTLNAPISPSMLKPSAPPPAAPAAAPPVAQPAPQPAAMLPPPTQRAGGFMLPDKNIEKRLEDNQQNIITGSQDLGRLQANVATTTAQAGADVARQKDESDRALFNKQLGIIQQEAQADAPFVPTKENAGTMALAFAMIGMIGSSLGGKNTTMSALGAQEAMTGMLKGWQEGDAEKYQEAKDAYNDNVAHLQRSVALAKDAFDIYQKEAASDISAAKAKWDVKIAEANAPVLAKTAEIRGFEQVGEMIKDQQTFNDKFIEANNKIVEESHRQAASKLTPVIDESGETQYLTPDQIEAGQMSGHQYKPATGQNGFGSSMKQSQNQRVINSLGEIATAVEPLTNLPKGSNVGFLPNLMTADGMTNAIRNYGGRKMTSDAADMMNTIFMGIGRNLATMETSGMGQGMSHLADQMQSGVYINPGQDDVYKVATKIADIRRVAESTVGSIINSGQFTPEQKGAAQQLLSRVSQLIPYTVNDVVKARFPDTKNTSIGSQIKSMFGDQPKPQPTQSDRAWAKAHPEDRQSFIDHFGVNP